MLIRTRQLLVRVALFFLWQLMLLWIVTFASDVASLVLLGAQLDLTVDNHDGSDHPIELQWHRQLLQEDTDERKQQDDGPLFLGRPVVYHDQVVAPAVLVTSTVHCVGENYQPDSWMYRSCQFHNLCWDTDTHEFLLFPSPEELALVEQLERMARPDLVTISSISRFSNSGRGGPHSDKMLSLGSIHDDPWPLSSSNATKNQNTLVEEQNQQWYPNVVKDPVKQQERLGHGYYRLPTDTVMFPVRLSETQVQFWDDAFAIFTVLASFGWEDKMLVLFPPTGSDLETNEKTLNLLRTHWGQALGMDSWMDSIPNGGFRQLANNGVGDHKSSLVCANYAAAGLGLIAATRQRTNALSPQEQILTHAVGRGGAYRSFRSFLLKKMAIEDVHEPSPHKVCILVHSESARELIVAALDFLGELQIESLDPQNESLKRQAAFAVTCKILVAEMNLPSAALIGATFLPEGSLLFVLNKGTNKETNREQRHVRDVLQLMGHFRLYWPRNPEEITTILRKQGSSLEPLLDS